MSEYSFRLSSYPILTEITTLPVRPAPPLSDCILALSGFPLDSGDDSSDEDLSKIVELLHTQIASTSVVHPPSTRPLPTSPIFACRLGKEILMPLGYKAAMDRWRVASPSTCHPLLPLEIPSSSTTPLPLSPSSTSPSPSLLPSSSRKRSRSPSPLLPPSVSPSPLPSPPPVAVPPPEPIELVGDYIETMRASLAFSMQETMTLRARVGLLEQHDVVTRDSLRIARGRITRATRMDIKDSIESREADRFEMDELRSRVQDIKASFWDHERHLGP
nr:hypothetical protein [Tanacetum cinerariifolium]